MEWTDFLHAGGNLRKLNVISMAFGWEWSKTGMTIYMRPINLLNVFVNWADFLNADCNAVSFG